MGFDTQDKEIVRLITKLKEADGKYPPELLAARRQRYLKQMGQVGLGVGLGAGIKNAARAGKAPALSSTTSTILESALVVAIMAETGTVAYFYRDKLAEIFRSITEDSRTQEVVPSPFPTTEAEQAIQGITPSPAVISTQPSFTLSTSPTAVELSNTPIPGVVEQKNTINASSTPDPNENNVNDGNNGNNGHHYGQTPKPDRTKEPNNNNTNNNNNNNGQPPRNNSRPPGPNNRP